MVNPAKAKLQAEQDAFGNKVVMAFSDSLRTVFYVSSALMIVATLIATGIVERPLRGDHDDTPGIA